MAIAIFGSKSKSRGLNALVCVPAVSDPACAALFTSSLLLFTEPEDRNMVLVMCFFACLKAQRERAQAGASGRPGVRVVARLRNGERLTDMSSVNEGGVLRGGWY